MKTYDSTDLEGMLDPSDKTMQRVIDDLDRACAPPMPAQMRAGIAHQLTVTAREGTGRQGCLWPVAIGGALSRGRLASLVAAVLLVLSGAAGYLRLQNPPPASAAQILRRSAAAAIDIPAGRVVHEITRVHLTQENVQPATSDLTLEQWTQVDGDGHPLQVNVQASSPNAALDERTVADRHGTLWTYGAQPNVVTKSTWTPGTSLFTGPLPSDPQAIAFLPKETMYAPQDPGVMRDLLTAAANGSDGSMRLLDRRTIDGRAVDAVQVTRPNPSAQSPHGWSRDVFTIYLDASTHLVRRIELRGVSAAGGAVFEQSFDVTTYEVVPVSSVPPGIFTFTPAPGTRICTPSEPASCETARGKG
jgi:hypothetical protein